MVYINFIGLCGVLSGFVGGVIGLFKICYYDVDGILVLGFDMGGISIDVVCYDGFLEYIFENIIVEIII